MNDKRGKPLPEWRVRVRRRFAEKGIDLEKVEQQRKQATTRALILGAVALAIFVIVQVVRILRYP